MEDKMPDMSENIHDNKRSNVVDYSQLLIDSQKEIKKSNRLKDKIIVLLIIFLFVEPIVFFAGFLAYESQYEYVTTTTETYEDTKDIDMSSEGDNASAEYNDVAGDQYNDNATHSEGGAVE